MALSSTTSNEGFLMNLPLDIHVEILSRLPAIDAIICKLVCKNWLNVLSTPVFAQLHLSRSNPCLFAVQYVVNTHKIFCGILKFDDENDDPVFEFDLRKTFEYLFCWANLINSINGLVCFHFGGREILYVCNPVTREYVTVPIPTAERSGEREDTVVYGFGVSTTSGKYKLVKISQTWARDDTWRNRIGIKLSRCRVYTLGTGSWTSICGVPNRYDYDESVHLSNIFFNGNLHWLIKDLEGSELISCFDMEKESFRPLPPPFPSKQPSSDVLFCLSLGVVAGCLCLCDNTSESDIVIWVMKEYGVKKSWTKDFVINKLCYSHTFLRFEKLLAVEIFKDGDILFTQSRTNALFTYSKESKTLQRHNKVSNLDLPPVLHVSSFVSLKAFELEKVRMFPHLVV